MRDENCIFCKIIAGEIPSRAIYEDDEFKAILDIAPAAKGHTLILPKNHCADLYEIDEKTLEHAARLAKKLGTNMKEKLGCQGLNVLQNNGELAGQTVFHYHMHLIPRYQEMEGKNSIQWTPQTFSDEEQDRVQKILELH